MPLNRLNRHFLPVEDTLRLGGLFLDFRKGFCKVFHLICTNGMKRVKIVPQKNTVYIMDINSKVAS